MTRIVLATIDTLEYKGVMPVPGHGCPLNDTASCQSASRDSICTGFCGYSEVKGKSNHVMVLCEGDDI